MKIILLNPNLPILIEYWMCSGYQLNRDVYKFDFIIGIWYPFRYVLLDPNDILSEL